MIIRSVPEDERASMELKVYAAEVLKGKRANWGFNRKWEGHYLAIVSTSAFRLIRKRITK